MTDRVVVIGAGFGGLATARGLKGADVEVTLVDRNNFHTFHPLLYQVATAGLNAADIAHPVRGIVRDLPNVTVRRARVTAVDWDDQVVELDDGGHVPFDHLVVAAGATANYFNIPGAAEFSLPLYTLDDAASLRNHVLSQFEAADANPALVEDGALTFVVVGGGPTGVEVAGALAELFDGALRRDFPSFDVNKSRIILVEALDDVLSAFRDRSRQDACTALRRRGVEVRLATSVASVSPRDVQLSDGERIASRTVIWAAGVQASPLAQAVGAEPTRGRRIVVGPDLRIPGHPNAFAIGDIAAVTDGQGNAQPLPGLAQVAMQSGRHVAGEIRRAIDGDAPRTFRYVDKGAMATIGRRAAVADLPFGVRLSGTVGWFAWLGLHLVQLVGFRNRLSVLVNWAWAYIGSDRGPRLIFDARRRHTAATNGAVRHFTDWDPARTAR
jgi:NADH:ubiquinone reductase (H+-translocating)